MIVFCFFFKDFGGPPARKNPCCFLWVFPCFSKTARKRRSGLRGSAKRFPSFEVRCQNQCHAEGGATKRGVSKCEQTQANADKRGQTQTNAEAKTQANASKREQTWTNANKCIRPPLLRFFYNPLCNPLTEVTWKQHPRSIFFVILCSLRCIASCVLGWAFAVALCQLQGQNASSRLQNSTWTSVRTLHGCLETTIVM